MIYKQRQQYLKFLIAIWLTQSCSQPTHHETETISTLPSTSVELNSLASFENAESKNWQIVGDVYANRHQENNLQPIDGIGVLANLPEENKAEALITKFEHGDIEMELDFMLPKGSNSGIYLQGRYELQLFDSWGKDSVSYGDCGGIYQRWNEQSNTGFEGIAPLVNACKAPGLWQHLKIEFQAPKFDSKGQKVANARFKKVILNNTTIHENVEVSGPTRGTFFEKEAPKGPIYIQGDHGPIAFRNFHYKTYESDRLQLTDLHYKFYQGDFYSFDTLSMLAPSKEGQTDSLTFNAAGDFDIYAIQFEGSLNFPRSGNYIFDLRGYGPIQLKIDDHLVADNKLSQNLTDPAYGVVEFKEGEHHFQLTFLKNERPWRRGMSLAYEGPQIPKTSLQAKSSVPTPPTPTPLLVTADQKAALQRGFLMHNGIKRTHIVTVGTPYHINYALEISNGALLEGWRGGFINATDMWHERGEAQLIQPLGSAQEFTAKPMFVHLSSSSSDWPDSLTDEDQSFKYDGYELSSSGIPTYFYDLEGIKISDIITPDSIIHGLTREIAIPPTVSPSSLYCLLAEGDEIEQLEDGSYAVNDKTYYLNLVNSGAKPILREQGGYQQLIVPLTTNNIKYSLIW